MGALASERRGLLAALEAAQQRHPLQSVAPSHRRHLATAMKEASPTGGAQQQAQQGTRPAGQQAQQGCGPAGGAQRAQQEAGEGPETDWIYQAMVTLQYEDGERPSHAVKRGGAAQDQLSGLGGSLISEGLPGTCSGRSVSTAIRGGHQQVLNLEHVLDSGMGGSGIINK
jgi:hypothetical protein